MEDREKLREAAALAILDEMDSGEEECELRAMLPFARRYADAALAAIPAAMELRPHDIDYAAGKWLPVYPGSISEKVCRLLRAMARPAQ